MNRKKINLLYKSFAFAFDTVEQFATYYNFSYKAAYQIIRIGRKINKVKI